MTKCHGEVIGKKVVYGFAKYLRDALPNATYLGFTGTPIEKTDVNTPAVFGQLCGYLRYCPGGGRRRHGAHLLRKPLGESRA
jgi:hypothetical protein